MTIPARHKHLVPVTGIPNVTHLEVAVFHAEGGINYATYKTERKGVYASLQPMTVSSEGHFRTERFMAFSGMKFLLEETTRLNRKKVAAHAAAVFPKAEALMALWFSRDYEGIRAALGALPALIEQAS